MGILVKSTPRRLFDWEWLFRPQFEPDTNTTLAYMRIEDTVYRVREVMFEHPDGSGARLWHLFKPDQTRFQVVPDPEYGLQCDCPKATISRFECEHVRAIRSAYTLIDTLNAIATASPSDDPH